MCGTLAVFGQGRRSRLEWPWFGAAAVGRGAERAHVFCGWMSWRRQLGGEQARRGESDALLEVQIFVDLIVSDIDREMRCQSGHRLARSRAVGCRVSG